MNTKQKDITIYDRLIASNCGSLKLWLRLSVNSNITINDIQIIASLDNLGEVLSYECLTKAQLVYLKTFAANVISYEKKAIELHEEIINELENI